MFGVTNTRGYLFVVMMIDTDKMRYIPASLVFCPRFFSTPEHAPLSLPIPEGSLSLIIHRLLGKKFLPTSGGQNGKKHLWPCSHEAHADLVSPFGIRFE